MYKVLKPFTIIPPDLYIQRDADKQVRNIINDMGRPGYVLVSRQMGKTNLLLNAKRKLETSIDAFIYIDLSNAFEDARSCFENIIDNAIETYPDKFNSISQEILIRRKELSEIPPHKQHTNELRVLLKKLNGGKLVIILDEIDALTKTNYSDQIFSQIRSSYFASRVNYPEFYNLTYLLSGVAEPNEIIKDPKVSPFNIGQKIYLNDFSRDEFEHFINASKLTLNLDVKDRIFYWTNGNPRITWDVCSAVENKVNKIDINIDLVDSLVNEIYLTTYDKPPVDNIRDLVKKDREIRNSIIEIESQKGKEISDRIKSKLYLAGIINYDENNIHIKNKIIKQSLNLDWIRSIEEEDKGLLRIAIELFDKNDFKESLNTFERYLEENEFPKEEKSLCFYHMGYASYRISDFKKSIQFLNLTSFNIEEERKMFFRTSHLKGLVYYYLDQIDESLECFKLTMENCNKDELYARALLNFGSISLKSDKANHKEEAIQIFNDIINETIFEKDKYDDIFINELKSIAHYNLAQIQNVSGSIEDAIFNFNIAIKLAKNNTKPAIILALLDITTNLEDKKVLLELIIGLINDGKITPIEEDPDKPIEFSFDQFKNIVIETLINFKETLFINLRSSLTILGDKNLAKHIFDLAIFSINTNKDWKIALKLFTDILNNFNNVEYLIDDETEYETLKFISYLSNINENLNIYIHYISLFAKERLVLVDYMDMEIFVNIIYFLTTKKKYLEAVKYANIINAIKDSVPENTLINYLVIYNLELNLYYYLNDRRKTILKAEEIIQLSNNEKAIKYGSHLLGETGLQVIRKNADTILHPVAHKNEPLRVGKTYGRNDIVKVRYKDGTITETKFKKVEADIKSEECFIFN